MIRCTIRREGGRRASKGDETETCKLMDEEEREEKPHLSLEREVEAAWREDMNNRIDLREGDEINRLKRRGERLLKRKRTENQRAVVMDLCLSAAGWREAEAKRKEDRTERREKIAKNLNRE